MKAKRIDMDEFYRVETRLRLNRAIERAHDLAMEMRGN
jgi:hypothetical protein